MSGAVWSSVADVEARWRVLTEGERERAAALIDDATSLILDEYPKAGETIRAESLRRIVCQMVKRAMLNPVGDTSVGGVGVSNASMTAGPYTQSLTFQNPQGDLYLSKSERRALSRRRGRAYEVDLLAKPEEGS